MRREEKGANFVLMPNPCTRLESECHSRKKKVPMFSETGCDNKLESVRRKNSLALPTLSRSQKFKLFLYKIGIFHSFILQ